MTKRAKVPYVDGHRTYRARKYKGFTYGALALARPESADKYGSGDGKGIYDPGFGPKLCDKWKRQTWRYERQPKIGLLEPITNGYNSPLSVMCVLDLLLRLTPGKYIFSADLTGVLASEYPHIVWDTTTVGRILGLITEEANLTVRINNQPAPMEVINFSNGRAYIINPSIQNHWWLGQLRNHFGKLAEEYQQKMIAREPAPRSEVVWGEVTTLPWGVKPE